MCHRPLTKIIQSCESCQQLLIQRMNKHHLFIQIPLHRVTSIVYLIAGPIKLQVATLLHPQVYD